MEGLTGRGALGPKCPFFEALNRCPPYPLQFLDPGVLCEFETNGDKFAAPIEAQKFVGFSTRFASFATQRRERQKERNFGSTGAMQPYTLQLNN